MYASVRTYRNVRRAGELTARVERELVPRLRTLPGFVSYHLFHAADRATAVTVFATEEGAAESARLAVAWARENVADFYDGEPEVTGSETFVALSDA
jgi:hypothetical protein